LNVTTIMSLQSKSNRRTKDSQKNEANMWPELDPVNGEEVGRIISARKATRHERYAYEQGYE